MQQRAPTRWAETDQDVWRQASIGGTRSYVLSIATLREWLKLEKVAFKNQIRLGLRRADGHRRNPAIHGWRTMPSAIHPDRTLAGHQQAYTVSLVRTDPHLVACGGGSVVPDKSSSCEAVLAGRRNTLFVRQAYGLVHETDK